MFEPACRGGSKRSLNISNPTPKWPRSPGEMVSAPDRAADTHTRTHALALTLTRTRTHAHAADPCAHRPAAAPPLRSESPFRLRDFFFLFNFQFAFAGLPPLQRGKQTLLPAGSFRSCWVLLWGGERARRPCFSVPAFPGSGARNPPSCGRGPGPGGARVRAEAVGPCLRWAPRASRPAPGAPAWPPPPWPCCLREGSLLCALGSTRNVGGAPCAALPLPPTLALLLGPHRGMGCLWEFGAARRWGPVLGRPCLTHRGGGRSGECSLQLGAPQTECRQAGESVGVRLPKFIPASLLPTHASPAPPRNL